MNSGVGLFRKTPACPSSTALLSFRSKTLSPSVTKRIKSHLGTCEFCRAEIALLKYYTTPPKRHRKAPDLPMNLRVLAESILAQGRKKRNVKLTPAQHGLKIIEE